jgi:caspase domain-containing protein
MVLALGAMGSSAAPLHIESARPVSITLSTWLKKTYPYQAAAKETTDPKTKRWAFIIGINDYASPTGDLVGSHYDATELRAALLNLGWRWDHIVLLLDRAATAQHIIDGLRWLELKATTSSTVVFHYSGHEKYTRTTADGDNETRDVELWGADNHYILDGVLGREMNRVHAYRMWIDISTCRAAGFNDYGMVKTGRVLTFSSTASEYSFDVPSLRNSAFGYYMIDLAIRNKAGDMNHDGRVSVEEAYQWSKPYVWRQTGYQQHPVIIDKAGGYIYLKV